MCVCVRAAAQVFGINLCQIGEESEGSGHRHLGATTCEAQKDVTVEIATAL